MSDAPPPPWREITTDDYAPRTFPKLYGSFPCIASSDRVYALLKGQHRGKYRGKYRLRLILREAVDLKRGPKVEPS